MEAGMQQAEDNIRLLKEASEQLSAKNFDTCLDLIMPDFILNIAEMPYQKHGRSAQKQRAESLLAAMPDVNVYVADIFRADDKIAVHLRIKDRHLGKFLGANPRRKVIERTNHEIYRFEGDRLADEWIRSDSLTLVRQLGLLSRTRLLSMLLAEYRFWLVVVSGRTLIAVLDRLW